VATEDTAGTPPIRPLVLAGDRLYLQRYWLLEVEVARSLTERRTAGPVPTTLRTGRLSCTRHSTLDVRR